MGGVRPDLTTRRDREAVAHHAGGRVTRRATVGSPRHGRAVGQEGGTKAPANAPPSRPTTRDTPRTARSANETLTTERSRLGQDLAAELDRGFFHQQAGAGERLAGLPDAVGEREHVDRAEHRDLLARFGRHLTGDDGAVRYALLGGPLEHAADDLAVEARHVDLALTGHHEIDAGERVLEAGRSRDHFEAGFEPGTDRGETAGEPTGLARAAG